MGRGGNHRVLRQFQSAFPTIALTQTEKDQGESSSRLLHGHGLTNAPRKIRALRRPQSVRAIKPIVEFPVEVAGLEAEHGAIGWLVGGKPSITLPDIFAVGSRRRDRRLANRRDL